MSKLHASASAHAIEESVQGRVLVVAGRERVLGIEPGDFGGKSLGKSLGGSADVNPFSSG
ncbi:hypothetical protein [Streptosporangium lutulentum]|uniref:Uncharacterized protein n=1 Tax=Streptosporangium lutulentum TaxID=1461250 RepID=A0ABT9QC24_9ACTN|nr:hypothetical protein [Streptosporangium lutulentum]MDP9844288.1 hypothetical protein [Streptosporangium lutulentum]